jgi:hypothetical protein
MEALSIAFDTVIVGALALPWVLIVIDLFFLRNQRQIEGVPGSMKRELGPAASRALSQPAVVSVLLFAVAYLLGSAISRNAKDFFNDDDLPLKSLTEDNIRTSTYCDKDQSQFVEIRSNFPGDSWRNHPGVTPSSFAEDCSKQPSTSNSGMQRVCSHLFGKFCKKYNDDTIAETLRIFQLQESALLLEGQDKTDRLRQLHEQIMVLEGAAFNAMIASALCLFGWFAKQRAVVRRSALVLPALLLVGTFYALHQHFRHSEINDPPFMEFTLLILAVAGSYTLWKGTPERGWFGTGFLLSFLFFGIAFFGWWWTEVLYNQQVNYSFYVQTHNLLRQIITPP